MRQVDRVKLPPGAVLVLICKSAQRLMRYSYASSRIRDFVDGVIPVPRFFSQRAAGAQSTPKAISGNDKIMAFLSPSEQVASCLARNPMSMVGKSYTKLRYKARRLVSRSKFVPGVPFTTSTPVRTAAILGLAHAAAYSDSSSLDDPHRFSSAGR